MTAEERYQAFLEGKIDIAPESGFDVPLSAINPALKSHQIDAVRWAVKGGCRALFEKFGLGKSVQQLEIERIITEREKGRGLIVCPLDVRLEFAHDAETILGLKTRYVRNSADIRQADETILITNYERVRDGDIDPSQFVVTSLDEAAILRSYGSKTYQEFLPLFKNVPYKYVATATPSPNRYKELIHYAGYLGIMDTGQALTRFFQRDSSKAGNLTLYPHMEDKFYLWLSTWALFLNEPADLGHPNEGYALPELDVRYHEVAVDHSGAGVERDGQAKLFRDAAASLPSAAKEKRESIELRIAKAAEIIAEDPNDHFLIWHDLDAERDEIKRLISDVAIVTGTGDLDKRAETLYDFAHGKIGRLATKKSISAAGGNFQRHCHRAIFVGIDHKFHDFIQAIHRIYRFLQDYRVRIDVIFTESERKILEDLLKKWTDHDKLQAKMGEIIQKYGLSASAKDKVLQRNIGVKRVEISGQGWTAVNNDCVDETARMEENSVDLIHTSIPFADHYEYTPSYNDFGFNSGNSGFFRHMDFLTPNLLRVLKPGRICAVHVKDRILFGNATGDGMPCCDSFHEETSLHFQKHGFRKIGMITVDTDVVRENNQTYRLGWTEQCKDGSKMGVGCPEYILLFRKLPTDRTKAYADDPVVKYKGTELVCSECNHVVASMKEVSEMDGVFICPSCHNPADFLPVTGSMSQLPHNVYTCAQWQLDAHAHWRSSGDRLMLPEELAKIADLPLDEGVLMRAWKRYNKGEIYDYHAHVAFVEELEKRGKLPKIFMVAPPVATNSDIWDDVNRMLTLNTTQALKGRQLHVCPLQLDIIERIITRYSNKGDLVYDPFGGIMSVPQKAVRMGRRGRGCELNSDYFRDGVGYLKLAEEEVNMPSLFDFL